MTNPMREVLVGLRSRFKHSFWGVNPRQRVSGERLGGKRCRPFHGLNGFCTFDLGLTPQAYAYTCFAVEKSHPLPLGVVRLLFKKPIYPARDNLKAAISRSLRTSTVSPTKTGWFQVLPSIALKRPTSAN